MTFADGPLSIVNVVTTSPLAGTPAGAEIVTVTVELPPRDPGLPAHRHPGPVYSYMIDGEMLFELEDEPPASSGPARASGSRAVTGSTTWPPTRPTPPPASWS